MSQVEDTFKQTLDWAQKQTTAVAPYKEPIISWPYLIMGCLTIIILVTLIIVMTTKVNKATKIIKRYKRGRGLVEEIVIDPSLDGNEFINEEEEEDDEDREEDEEREEENDSGISVEEYGSDRDEFDEEDDSGTYEIEEIIEE